MIVRTAHSPKLLAEAFLLLCAISPASRLIKFSALARWSVGRKRDQALADAECVDGIRRAVLAWSRRLPLRTECLEQGIAAARMLSMRNKLVTLFYGAAMIDGELKAHVWVRSGELDIIGCENAGDFAILSQFSNAPSSSPVHS